MISDEHWQYEAKRINETADSIEHSQGYAMSLDGEPHRWTNQERAILTASLGIKLGLRGNVLREHILFGVASGDYSKELADGLLRKLDLQG